MSANIISRSAKSLECNIMRASIGSTANVSSKIIPAKDIQG